MINFLFLLSVHRDSALLKCLEIVWKQNLVIVLEVVDVIGYYELNQEKIQGIDFIVSAVDLSNLYFQVPVFTVSVFLKNDEIAQIRAGDGSDAGFESYETARRLTGRFRCKTVF